MLYFLEEHRSLILFIVSFLFRTEFCKQLENLVNLAPPLSSVSETPPSERIQEQIDKLLHTELFQSILVSKFHHWEPSEEMRAVKAHHHHQQQQDHFTSEIQTDESLEDEVDEESFDPPWPNEHERFCALPLIQEHVILEIAAGLNSKGRTAKPMEISKGKMKVVLPGSLRERGEFCLVDVSFMKETTHKAVVSKSKAFSVESPRCQETNCLMHDRRELLVDLVAAAVMQALIGQQLNTTTLLQMTTVGW